MENGSGDKYDEIILVEKIASDIRKTKNNYFN